MQKMMRHSQALYQVAAAVNSTLEPSSVLQAIVQNTVDAMQVKACSIMLLSPDGTELRHSAHHGLSQRYVSKGPVRMDPDLAEPLMGTPTFILEATSDPRVQYHVEAREEGIASMLTVPIRLRGEVVGVMRVYTGSPRDFSQEDVEFFEAVANLGAIALDNASRYAEAQADLEQLRSYVFRYGGS